MVSEGDVLEDQYEIERKIGDGGEGNVYSAKDLSRGRKVAIKDLRFYTDDALDTLNTIVTNVRELESPYLITIHNTQFSGDQPYYVMDFAEYGTLYDNDFYVENVKIASEIFLKICRGVKDMHRSSPEMVHRDLKPSNILFVDSQKEPKVADFGLSYVPSDDEETVTERQDQVGPVNFAAPEQTDNPPNPNPRSDIFSLGRMYFYMITGERPGDINHKPSILDYDISDDAFISDVNQLIQRMTNYEMSDRPSDVTSIIERIEEILELEQIDEDIELSFLQKQVLKYIRSFYSDTVSFSQISNHMSNFYTESERGLKKVKRLFLGKYEKSKFDMKIKNAIETLEERNYVEMRNGEYQYKYSEEAEELFHDSV